MNMQQCSQGGHFYDASVHAECPYCKNAAGAPVPDRTVPVDRTVPIDRTTPIAPNGYNPSGDNYARAVGGGDGRTVAVIKEELGIDPVVGWLVNMEGKEKGRDYRIHSDNNFIGRSEKMDICIRGDDTISRDNHAIIAFDTRDRIFFFSPGEGRSLVRLNDRAIFTTTELKAFDVIEIGKTKLVFVPLCGEKFEWA